MASHQQPSPTTAMSHHGHPQAVPNGHPPTFQAPPQLPAAQSATAQTLKTQNELVWVQLGELSDKFGDSQGALECFDRALQHNTWSVPALNGIASVLREREQFQNAIEYLKQIIKIEQNNGDVWGGLGHCYLMLDNLQQAYTAYQQALYHLQNPKEPKLWYGIGILYDRYGSLEHAEEAFSEVMRMEPNFEKANEIYFRLGIIYKQQQKYQSSLECFQYIVQNPPRPLSEEDIWFQIGHVYEQQKDYDSAKAAYLRVLDRDPNHAKVLQQLGWLHHQQSQSFSSQEQAIEYLEKSVNADQTDAQSWYLLGRCYMSQQKYPKAYEAYQQAVYRDGRNPTFWCSIGVLYYQINQYRDALDAYSRAIRLNPNISEVWYDLGTLYESCNNQTADALDAYQRAAELDPQNVHIKARLQLLQNGGQATNGLPNQNSTPLPQDIPPTAYQPTNLGGPPAPQWGAAPQPQHPPQAAPPVPSVGHSGSWDRPIAGLREPPPPPGPSQQLHIHEQRESVRPPPVQHGPPPMTSPRYEHMRAYPEPPRTNPPPPLPPQRRLSPSPKPHNAVPLPYQQGSSSVPPVQHQAPPPPQPPLTAQAQPQQQPPPPPPSQAQAPQAPNRIANPNYGPPPNLPGRPSSSMGGPPPPHHGHLPAYARMASPPSDARSIESRVMSPRGHYTEHRSYPPPNEHPLAHTMERGPPPPPALGPPELASREMDNRTPTAPKRPREWEDDHTSSVRTPSDEKKMRLEEPSSRRSSPPQFHRMPSPPRRSPPDSEQRRAEEARRANEGYHPSEAAHHPPSLPSMMAAPAQGPPPPPLVSTPSHQGPPHPPPPAHAPEPTPTPKPEPPREVHEPAARKMEVDEDYSDGGEEDKRNGGPVKSERSSPRSAVTGQNGMPPHAQTPVDQKA